MLIDHLEDKDQLAGAAAYTRSIRLGWHYPWRQRCATRRWRSAANNARTARGRKGKAADLGFKPTPLPSVGDKLLCAAPNKKPTVAGWFFVSDRIRPVQRSAQSPRKTPMGIWATPKRCGVHALVANTWPSSSLAPLVTRCCSVKSPVEFTRLIT